MEMHCVCTAHQLCPGRSSVEQLHQVQFRLHIENYLLCSHSHFMHTFVHAFIVFTSCAPCHEDSALVKGNIPGGYTSSDCEDMRLTSAIVPKQDMVCLQSTFKVRACVTVPRRIDSTRLCQSKPCMAQDLPQAGK